LEVREILRELKEGKITIEEAERRIRLFAVEKLGDFAKIDIGRETRKGIPEIILGEGKSDEEIIEISRAMTSLTGRAIISRLKKEQVTKLCEFAKREGLQFKAYERAGIVIIKNKDYKDIKTGGKVGIITGGTSDIPVAEEVIAIAEEMGCDVFYSFDVGIAGIQRTIEAIKEILEKDVDVLVVVAGREGTLPTFVANFVDIPIIGVPTSIGYGHAGKGESALSTMLQSCSLGIAVVNIDGGVAAGTIAALIANRVAKKKHSNS